jgi:hypothetical protein
VTAIARACWSDNGDGTAWVLRRGCPDERAGSAAHTNCHLWGKLLDRPCGTCGGRVEVYRQPYEDGPEMCPDCDGTGRHTFEVIAAVPHWGTLHRVHVEPDMILPIEDLPKSGYTRTFERFAYVSKAGALRVVDHDAKTDTYMGRAPAGTKKGAWAILLAVHS